MATKEHWTRRLKRENAELKQENQRLKEKQSNAPPTAPDFAELKAAIEADAITVDANTIANMLLNDVCIKHDCRENVFIMEKGESVKGQPFRLTDSAYQVVSREMMQRILKETRVDAIEYEAQDFDCEDFARHLVSRAVSLGVNSWGRVFGWSGHHAFNIAIVQKGDGVEAVFIEAQTDQIVNVFDGKYNLSNALIVIS